MKDIADRYGNETLLSQSLPNQVNDFNEFEGASAPSNIDMSQSLPNQVNDFNRLGRASGGMGRWHVAIPSKPGQRLQ